MGNTISSNLKPEDWEAWRANLVTQAFMIELSEAVKKAQESLGEGNTLNLDSSEYTHAKTAQLVGYIAGLNVAKEIPEGEATAI